MEETQQHTCRLGHTIKILKSHTYRKMKNLYDTLCTNSKVSVTLTSLLFESNYTSTVSGGIPENSTQFT